MTQDLHMRQLLVTHLTHGLPKHRRSVLIHLGRNVIEEAPRANDHEPLLDSREGDVRAIEIEQEFDINRNAAALRNLFSDTRVAQPSVLEEAV